MRAWRGFACEGRTQCIPRVSLLHIAAICRDRTASPCDHSWPPLHGKHVSVRASSATSRRKLQLSFSSARQGVPASSELVVGVVVVDHGSKRAESNDMLVEFASLYQQVSGRQIVEPAHMEIAEPSILQAVTRCAERGATKIIVAPYFLSRGRHIQQDIPALVAQAQAQLPPGITCIVADPIGVDALMAQLVEARVEAAAGRGGG